MARKKRTDNKNRVLKVGEGQRSDGVYYYRYSDLSGKRRTVYASSLPELRDEEDEISEDLHDGIDTSKGDMTLNELFRVYMNTKTDLRDSTRYNYEAIWKNAIAETPIGNMRICQIKQVNVKSFYADMTKKGLSENTIKLYHLLISSALELAVNSDMIRKNPAKDCGRGIRGTKKERVAMTREEQEAFMNYVNQSDRFAEHAPMITFALATALRVGELTGLRWSDVDFSEGIIHIKQQLVYKNYGDGCRFHVQDLKTAAGYRDIPMTDAARSALLRERELDMKMGKLARRQEVEGVNDFVFINKQGKPFATNAINLILKDIVDAYNSEHEGEMQLPHVSAHILRHTACTRLAESGIDVKVLQYIMGHSDISVTLNTYTHLDFTHIQEEIESVQGKVLVG